MFLKIDDTHYETVDALKEIPGGVLLRTSERQVEVQSKDPEKTIENLMSLFKNNTWVDLSNTEVG